MKSPENEERTLVERAIAGCPDAFGELVIRYAPRVSSLVYRHIGNTDSALDVSQSTFMKAFRQIRALRSTGNFRPWLFRIAVNESLRFLKARARFRSLESPAGQTPEETPSGEPGPADRMVMEERREAVLAALGKLPPRQRSVFVLRYLEGLSTAEVAEILSCSENSVKANLSHALKTLRDRLVGDK